jgi:hypothetical protein
MVFCLREKMELTRSTRFCNSRPNSAACFRNLLIRFASCPTFKIVEPISGENQMRMGIDESRHYNATVGIENFCVANILLDFVARTDAFNFPVADEHSTVSNDPEFRQLCRVTWALGSAQRDELRSVQDSEGTHCSLP